VADVAAVDVRLDAHPPTGIRDRVHGYATMTRWELASLRLQLPLVIIIQCLAGAGFILGVGLFFDHVPPVAAVYVSTGVPVINLIIVGLIFGPQIVADQKLAHSYDYLRSMPVSTATAALSWYTVTLIAGIPSVIVSLLIAEARYHLAFTITPAIVPAALLTAFTGTMMGYALSHAVSDPMKTRLVAQLLVFAVMGFTPITYPITQQPPWLAALNWFLPFRHMAVIVRSALMAGTYGAVATSYLIVAIWGVVCAALAARALRRRS
jgi:ABC-2 type transport system permease protein